jgi:hypothetical protein
MWTDKETYFRTALKFHRVNKMKIQKHLKGYYKIHRSKSMNRKFVSGGPKLKSSGIYTEQFCQAVLEVWDMACSRKVEGFAGEYTLAAPYTRLWSNFFGQIMVDED